jgi:hypothetical protein
MPDESSPRPLPIRPAAWRWVIVAACLCVLASGCVRRRMLIRSNPPGALVYVDDYEIGRTPIATNFTYYGDFEVKLVKDGYETLTVKQRFKAPWYQIPPFDFFSENLTPKEFRDERIVAFELEPQRVVPVNELLGRAEQLRQSTQAGYTIAPPPAGATAEPPTAPPSLPTDGNSLPPPFYPPQ